MNIRNTNLNLLKLLHALLTEKHVSKAAARAFITQPAMSNALIRLRKLFADPLLIRAGKGMTLTPFAEQLLPKVKTILLAIEQLPQLDFNPQTTNMTFKIGIFDFIDALVLPMLMEKLAPYHGNIQLQIKKIEALIEPTLLDELGLDFAISNLAKPAPYLHAVTIKQEEAICIVRQNHPLAKKKLTLPRYLQAKHLAIVVTVDTLQSITDQALTSLGYQRDIVLATPNVFSALAIIAKTDLIGTVPKSLAIEYQDKFNLVLLKSPVSIPNADIKLIWHQRSHNDSAHQWLRELIQQTMRSQ